MNVLVDTSVWSVAIRREHADVSARDVACRTRLEALIQEGRIEIIGPIRQELLSGIRRQPEFDRLRQYLSVFLDVALITEDYEQAAGIHNVCRSAGIAGSAVDFLICAAAIRRGWEVFTLDKDFRRYASKVSLTLHAWLPQ